jgi:hypothetical protein
MKNELLKISQDLEQGTMTDQRSTKTFIWFIECWRYVAVDERTPML